MCERKRQLLEDLLRVLSRVSHVSGFQAEISGDLSEMDTQLKQAVAEQNQALLALQRHQQEHGC